MNRQFTFLKLSDDSTSSVIFSISSESNVHSVLQG